FTWCIERWVAWNWEGFKSDSLLDNAIMAFLVVGPVEEGSKFLAVRAFIYESPHFDEPIDGIIYSAVVATGFALAENLLLTFDAKQMIWVQGLCGTLAHILFASYWGAALGWEKNANPKKAATIWVGISLVVSALLHGLFDFSILISGQTLPHPISRAILTILVATSFLLLRWQMNRAKRLQG
ncbi:MAG: PrsW family intramembrane metalloprotease, partial [Armatimonadota bacterium]